MCKLVTGFRTKKVLTFFRTSQNSQCTGVSTFAIRTSPSTDQSLQKSFHLSYADKIETVYGSRTPLKIKYEVSN